MSTSVPLKQRITEDMKTAMKSQDKPRLATVRLILAAMKQREVDERIELSDADIAAILNKMLKQRRDSITQYQAASRQDLVDQETFEVNVIQAYLPAQMSEADVEKLVQAAIAECGAKSAADMGKVMAIVKPKIQGKADLSVVSQLVKTHLSK
jgi:uncharacterized protein YqeY